jgi:hypothetical protein
MSRAYRCDGPCQQPIARDREVTILKAHKLGSDDQSPWLGVKIRGRTYVHLCADCMERVAAIAVYEELAQESGEERVAP